MYPKLVTIGETMVLFDPASDGPLRYTNEFLMKYGGAESNVAIGAARLGHQVGWVSQVGDDEFGKYIVSRIRGEGVDTSRVKFLKDYPTSLYIKERIREGSTQVYYYRQDSAFSKLNRSSIDWDYLSHAEIIHISGISLFLSDESRELIFEVARFANERGITLSFDPNLRFKLMDKVQNAKQIVLDLVGLSDIFLPGVDEAEYLIGTRDYKDIASYFLSAGASKVIIKDGDVGSYYASNSGEEGFQESFKVERVVDPIGAGDGFAAGVLAGLIEGKDLAEAVKMGAKVGALVVTVRGDIEGLPERHVLEGFGTETKDIMR